MTIALGACDRLCDWLKILLSLPQSLQRPSWAEHASHPIDFELDSVTWFDRWNISQCGTRIGYKCYGVFLLVLMYFCHLHDKTRPQAATDSEMKHAENTYKPDLQHQAKVTRSQETHKPVKLKEAERRKHGWRKEKERNTLRKIKNKLLDYSVNMVITCRQLILITNF